MSSNRGVMEGMLARYREFVAIHSAMDYGDRSSVRKGNAAADELRRIANEVRAAHDAVAIRRFATLLDDANAQVRRWAATHLLELMSPPQPVERRALDVLERVGKEDSVEGLGTRMWLKEWYARSRRPERDEP